MIQTIKDIYDYRREDNSPMLSPFEPAGDIDFWKPYRDNFPYFDRLFMKKYRSWFPMDQEGDIEDIAVDFAYDVKSWLMINTKRYAELFRIETIPDDEKYSLTDNVFEHEVVETEFGKTVTFNKGEQEIKDEGSTDYALHETTDNRSLSYGLHDTTDNRTLSYGLHETETGVTENLGATEKTTENSTSAFNESGYTAVDKSVVSDDAIENGTTTEFSDKAHEDTDNRTIQSKAHEDTDNRTIQSKAHKDETANTRTDGAREDTTEDSGTETVTRDRAGNIGIKDVPQIFMDQRDFWVSFAYYDFIFSEITRELLRGVM